MSVLGHPSTTRSDTETQRWALHPQHNQLFVSEGHTASPQHWGRGCFGSVEGGPPSTRSAQHDHRVPQGNGPRFANPKLLGTTYCTGPWQMGARVELGLGNAHARAPVNVHLHPSPKHPSPAWRPSLVRRAVHVKAYLVLCTQPGQVGGVHEV